MGCYFDLNSHSGSVCLFVFERIRKNTKLGVGGGAGRSGEGETVIRTYYMKKKSIFNGEE